MKLKAPALSVVIPVRNDARRLSDCLLGLRASTFQDHEVIVVDDASTDESAAVAQEMGARLIRKDRRGGPAAARNSGAEAAHGTYLFFIDADVCVHPDTLARVMQVFQEDPAIDAVFGSYDRRPKAPNLLSQYKNLFHHFVHQQGRREASTFWSGCGAIKRSVFRGSGGFDTGYGQACIEDIELGVRLIRAGRRIILDKQIQATHLKKWTLVAILKSDIWDRGVPWTELILREGRLPDDLNLKPSQRVSALLAYVLAALTGVGIAAWPPLALLPISVLVAILLLDRWSLKRKVPPLVKALGVLFALAGLSLVALHFKVWAFAAFGLLGLVVGINRRFYNFFARERGLLFALMVMPLHLLYYAYSGVALAIGALRFVWRTKGPAARRTDVKPEANAS